MIAPTSTRRSRGREQRINLEEQIIISMAGPLAEYLFCNSGLFGVQSSLRDVKEVAHLVHQTGFSILKDPEESSAYFSWALIRTKNILTTPRVEKAIIRLVELLVAEPVIEGDKAMNIIRSAMGQ